MKPETPARFYCAVLLVVASMVAVGPGEALLRLEGQSLSGRPVVLPDDAHGKIASWSSVSPRKVATQLAHGDNDSGRILALIKGTRSIRLRSLKMLPGCFEA